MFFLTLCLLFIIRLRFPTGKSIAEINKKNVAIFLMTFFPSDFWNKRLQKWLHRLQFRGLHILLHSRLPNFQKAVAGRQAAWRASANPWTAQRNRSPVQGRHGTTFFIVFLKVFVEFYFLKLTFKGIFFFFFKEIEAQFKVASCM